MSHELLVTILGPDRVGIVAAVAGRLYDLGGNIGDVSFAVLGASFDFSATAELPDQTGAAEVERELAALPELEGATLSVRAFKAGTRAAGTGRVTHRVQLSGGDRPGLIARVSEAFVEFGANVVRLTSERVLETAGTRYVIRFDVAIPPDRAAACLASVSNTAGQLQMECHYETARG